MCIRDRRESERERKRETVRERHIGCLYLAMSEMYCNITSHTHTHNRELLSSDTEHGTLTSVSIFLSILNNSFFFFIIQFSFTHYAEINT